MPKLPPNVRQHGNGYGAVVQVAGQRHWGPIFATPEEASEYAKAYKKAAVPNKVATLTTGIELLREDLEETGARDATFSFYTDHLTRVLEHFGADTPLHRIRADDVRRYIRTEQQAGLTNGTIRKRVNALSRLMKVAVQARLIPFDPTANLKRPTHRAKRFSALTPERVLEISNQIRGFQTEKRSRPQHLERDADIVLFAFFTGMRRAELSRVRPIDIDLERREITVDGKTGTRQIPIAKQLAPIVERLMDGKPDEEPLLPDPRALAWVFQAWRGRLGLKAFSPHMLRHSFASAAAARGVTPYVLRDLLGHRRLEQVLTYYHSQGDASREAVDSLLPEPEQP